MLFPVPLPARCIAFGNGKSSCDIAAVAVVGLGDLAMGSEGGEMGIECRVAYATGCTELANGHLTILRESLGDAVVERGGRWVVLGTAVDGGQGQDIALMDQLQGYRGSRGCGAVLDRQREVVSAAVEVEVGVAPGMEFGGAAQGLAIADAAAALLGVVDHGDGDTMMSLQFAQDLGAGPAVVWLQLDAEEVAHLAIEVLEAGLWPGEYADLHLPLGRKPVGEDTQRDGFARARVAGDQGETALAGQLFDPPTEGIGTSKRRPRMETVPSLLRCVRFSARVRASRNDALSGLGRETSGPARNRAMGASPVSEWTLRLYSSSTHCHKPLTYSAS
jgi:hypothetical protein